MSFRDPHDSQPSWFYRLFLDPKAWDSPWWGTALLCMFMYGCFAAMWLIREIAR